MTDPLDGPTAPEPGSYDAPAGEEERRRAAEASLREERLRRVEAAILAGPDGREWLWAILSDLHTFEKRIPMTASQQETEFWNGEREAGIRLFQRFVDVDPANFAAMFIENRGK